MKGYCIMNIYEKIFARLEELHMSQIELSRRTGIATSTISDWRKKQINTQTDKLVAICKRPEKAVRDYRVNTVVKDNKATISLDVMFTANTEVSITVRWSGRSIMIPRNIRKNIC